MVPPRTCRAACVADSSQSSEPDYETLLSQLEASIKAREDHLLSIRLRERRANALFITYGLGAWLVYLLLWYFRILARGDGLERVMRAAPVVGGPVACVPALPRVG